MKYHHLLLSIGIVVLSQAPLAAQIGDRTLNGAYYVRQLNARGAKSAQGVITFDGGRAASAIWQSPVKPQI